MKVIYNHNYDYKPKLGKFRSVEFTLSKECESNEVDIFLDSCSNFDWEFAVDMVEFISTHFSQLNISKSETKRRIFGGALKIENIKGSIITVKYQKFLPLSCGDILIFCKHNYLKIVE